MGPAKAKLEVIVKLEDFETTRDAMNLVQMVKRSIKRIAHHSVKGRVSVEKVRIKARI